MSLFASLKIRNYRLYTIGQTTSVAGNWMQNIAVGWLTLELSHSGTVLGLVTGARYLPLLLFGTWGGLVADRHNRRRLLLVTQVCFAVLAALLTAASATHVMTLPLLFVIVLTIGCTNIFDNPARQSLISELVDREHLSNAIAVNSTLMNVAKLVGPAVAGLIIAGLGVTLCFGIDALSFVAVIISLFRLRVADMYPARQEVRAKRQIQAALATICGTPELLYPMLMVYVTGILTWEFPVTLPLLTTSVFHAGAAGYGTAMAVMSAGAVLGGYAAVRRRRHSIRSLATSALIWGALVCAAALAPSLPTTLAVLVFVGAGSITFNSSAKTVLQLTATSEMRGRVMSVWSIGWLGSTVIGAPAVGAIAAAWGARSALLVGGLAPVVIGAIVLARSAHLSGGEDHDGNGILTGLEELYGPHYPARYLTLPTAASIFFLSVDKACAMSLRCTYRAGRASTVRVLGHTPGEDALYPWMKGIEVSDSTAEHAGDWWSGWSDAKFFDIIFTQRATRVYKAVEINQDVLGKILRAATFAPSATNTQPWEFLAVQDRDLKVRLQEIARKTYEAADAQRGRVATLDGAGRPVTGRASVDNMVNASALVLVFWNPDRGIRIKNQYVENPDGTLTETNHVGSGRGASIFQACQNMMLAAQALGVQSIFTAALCDAQREVKELLGVPPRMFLEAVIYLGYGDEHLGRPRRKALAEVAHLDHWGVYWPGDSAQNPT